MFKQAKHHKTPKKTMHPRNIYNKKIDYKELALKYPDFKEKLKQDLSGKLILHFKDEESLRVLAKTLLKEDFDLVVNLPKGFLVPTIPLRLNYILWLEDVLNQIGTYENRSEIRGIDIGTGASCIYPLLAVKKNKWFIVATDNDPESVKYAQENVVGNKLQEHIKVVKTEDTPLLGFVKDGNEVYDFCMCNPPFFGIDDLDIVKDRRDNRPKPHNAPTGKTNEIATEGGEEDFISEIIKESQELQTKIRIYTTMVGVRKSLPRLIKHLQQIQVKSFQEVEFIQGHTTRWALSWTFCDYDFNKMNIHNAVSLNTTKKKVNKSYVLKIPKPGTNVEEICDKLRNYFSELSFVCTEYTHENTRMFEVHGFERTWTNQRRKRREMERKQNQVTSEECSKRKAEPDEDRDKKRRKYDPELTPLLHINITVRDFREEENNFDIIVSTMNDNFVILNEITQYFANKFGTKNFQTITTDNS